MLSSCVCPCTAFPSAPLAHLPVGIGGWRERSQVFFFIDAETACEEQAWNMPVTGADTAWNAPANGACRNVPCHFYHKAVCCEEIQLQGSNAPFLDSHQAWMRDKGCFARRSTSPHVQKHAESITRRKENGHPGIQTPSVLRSSWAGKLRARALALGPCISPTLSFVLQSCSCASVS